MNVLEEVDTFIGIDMAAPGSKDKTVTTVIKNESTSEDEDDLPIAGDLVEKDEPVGDTDSIESMFMMMRHVFDDLKYRRYEWKCNAANAASCNAALRFGFSAEGIFRQAGVVKGRSRDTAWFSIIDSEWPAIKTAYETWLSSDNFDKEGRQKTSLKELMLS